MIARHLNIKLQKGASGSLSDRLANVHMGTLDWVNNMGIDRFVLVLALASQQVGGGGVPSCKIVMRLFDIV